MQGVEADFLIIGSGIAALRAAVALSGANDVLILTKADPLAGNTGYAQGGIAAAVGPDDSPAQHLADTLAAGDGLCDERAVEVLVNEGPRYVRELIEWGAAFDRTPDGAPALAIEGAHSVRRVLHAHDATGREIGRVLWERVARLPNVRVVSDARAVRLLVEQGARAGENDRAVSATNQAARAAGRCWRPEVRVRFFARRPIRLSRPAMASRSRTTPDPRWRISSSCSFTRRRCT